MVKDTLVAMLTEIIVCNKAAATTNSMEGNALWVAIEKARIELAKVGLWKEEVA